MCQFLRIFVLRKLGKSLETRRKFWQMTIVKKRIWGDQEAVLQDSSSYSDVSPFLAVNFSLFFFFFFFCYHCLRSRGRGLQTITSNRVPDLSPSDSLSNPYYNGIPMTSQRDFPGGILKRWLMRTKIKMLKIPGRYAVCTELEKEKRILDVKSYIWRIQTQFVDLSHLWSFNIILI